MLPEGIVMWQGLHEPSMELLRVTRHGDITQVESLFAGVYEGAPLQAGYTVELNAHGGIQSVRWGDRWLARRDGQWRLGYLPLGADFDVCSTIDIRQTPFTNTLAIKELELAVGETKTIWVIFLYLNGGGFVPQQQQYTRLSERRYRFDNLDGGFVADIEVDANDFVVDYPGLFQQVYPSSLTHE